MRATCRTVLSCSTGGILAGNRKSAAQMGWGLACQLATQAGAMAWAVLAGRAAPVVTANASMAEAEALESDFIDVPYGECMVCCAKKL